jgi:glutathione S-transferase
MILYGNTVWTSPYVLSSFVALREKGLPFEVHTVDLAAGAQRDPGYAQTSLTSRVPTLIDSVDGIAGAFALSESSAIVEYLEDAYPAPGHARVLPADVRSRARARQVMAWVRSDLGPIREERSAEYVFYPHASLAPYAPLSPEGLRAADKLLEVAESLVPATGALFGAWCVADTDLAMMLQRLIKTGHDVPERIRDYAETQWQRPAVQEFVRQERPPYKAASLR